MKALEGITFIGVDPAARRLAATALFDDGWRLHKRTMPTDPVLRLVKAEYWMYQLVRQYGGRVVVGIELPVLGGRGGRAAANGTIPIAMIHAVMAVGAVRAGAQVLQVNNKRWKKTIVGNGNADKAAIMRFVKKTWPRLYREADGSQDLMDSACIVQHVKYVMSIRARVAATQARGNRG